MADQVSWQLSGDYFENCSCSIVCPCLVSAAAPLTARPTEGFCNVPLVFHVETGIGKRRTVGAREELGRRRVAIANQARLCG